MQNDVIDGQIILIIVDDRQWKHWHICMLLRVKLTCVNWLSFCRLLFCDILHSASSNGSSELFTQHKNTAWGV